MVHWIDRGGGGRGDRFSGEIFPSLISSGLILLSLLCLLPAMEAKAMLKNASIFNRENVT